MKDDPMVAAFRAATPGEITAADEGPHLCEYGCWDWNKGSQAIVASDGQHSVVLDHIGGPLDYWESESGRDSMLEQFDGMEPGLWVCDVSILSSRSYEGEYDEELSVDDARKLTDEEWALVRDGDVLWTEAEWRQCKCAEGEGEGEGEGGGTTYPVRVPIESCTACSMMVHACPGCAGCGTVKVIGKLGATPCPVCQGLGVDIPCPEHGIAALGPDGGRAASVAARVIADVMPDHLVDIEATMVIEDRALVDAVAANAEWGKVLGNVLRLARAAIRSGIDEIGGKRAANWSVINDALVAIEGLLEEST